MEIATKENHHIKQIQKVLLPQCSSLVFYCHGKSVRSGRGRVRERRQSRKESVQPGTSSWSSQTFLSPSNPELSLLIPALPLSPPSPTLAVSPSSARPPPQSRPEWGMKATVLGLRRRLEHRGEGGRGAQEPGGKVHFLPL